MMACLTLLHGRAPELGEIAAALGVTKAAASYRLQWLEKKGLCNRATREVTELGLHAALRPSRGPEPHHGRVAWRARARINADPLS